MIYNKENFSIDAFHTAKIYTNEDFKSPGLERKWHLLSALEKCTIDGLILEFGVFSGKTINLISSKFTEETVWGFDSFEGLPEDWIRAKNEGTAPTRPKGHFSVEKLPVVNSNVRLVKGFFRDSLPQWITEHNSPIKFLHIDCDLYSSTKEVLTILNNQITPGTIIVFDEMYPWRLYNTFDLWEECEFKALKEWINENDREFETVYRNRYQQCSIKITK